MLTVRPPYIPFPPSVLPTSIGTQMPVPLLSPMHTHSEATLRALHHIRDLFHQRWNAAHSFLQNFEGGINSMSSREDQRMACPAEFECRACTPTPSTVHINFSVPDLKFICNHQLILYINIKTSRTVREMEDAGMMEEVNENEILAFRIPFYFQKEKVQESSSSIVVGGLALDPKS
ncbi:hypothetical protein SISSUDRAFT_551563 [Sistotremastrum suecicum HHB10207 ss-3]|uniref:Uncharacterized protein n=1 Tax=Sistotremastrum suecicum HHB10207 ss-3 TaxID=1314776 RepID=A0A165XN76_9AGAM|nr:hypothetical protein SISSUDRAFT_551563 [Sistotremastrum suecicum HHB10207 ss-3]